MERMTERGTRALRGTVAAAVAVLLASTAHTLSGGDAPPFWLVLAVTVLAAPLCVALVGRRRNVTRTAASVVVAQVALHAAFAAVGSAAPTALHGAHHHTLVLLDPTVDPAAATMTLGHAVAAVVTIVLLAWGERMLAAIARGIRRLLRLAPPSAPRTTVRPATPVMPSRATPAVCAHSVSRRGPPARCASLPAV